MAFQRTLDQDFIDALNQLHDEPSSWWRRLVDSPDVFLAIRNNYLNAYSCGMSIGKIVREGSSIRLLVHEEYLTLTSREPYVDLLSPRIERTRPLVLDTTGYLAQLARVKRRAGRFAGDERKGTNNIACKVLTVLDMEAAFDGTPDDPDPESEEEVWTGHGRMDLIVLTPDRRLRAIEAKLFANKELVAKERPEVCGQLEEYYRFLSAQQSPLGTAYRNLISVFGQLRGKFFETRVGHPSWLQAQSDHTALSVDPVPRLLIFGFDRLQGQGVKKIVNQIQKHLTIPGFGPDHIIPVGHTTSINETHFA